MSGVTSQFSAIKNSPKCLNVLLPIVTFCWPLVFFFPLLAVYDDHYFYSIGNDFYLLYYNYKIYLLDCLSHLRIPLWSPSEGAGYPFYSSPFTQTFYPPNILLATYYFFRGGYSAFDHQYFTVLGISIFSLGLYFWLRLFRIDFRAILFAVLVMSVSFKITEILRFPNAVHTAAWYPWILFIITKILTSISIKKRIKYSFFLICFSICFITAGYPYYIYYSLFLFFPYLSIFIVPRLRIQFFGNRIVNLASFSYLILSGIISILICGPYLIEVAHLMEDTTDRGGDNLAYSTAHLFDYHDTVGSLIFPPAAQAEGWYYFGVLGVLLIFLYLTATNTIRFNDIKLSASGIHSSHWYQDIVIKIFFLSWIGVITYITYGRDSYLFLYLWEYMPGFSNLRVWGRMNIVLVPIIGLLLAIAYDHFEKQLCNKNTPRGKWINSVLLFLGFYCGIIYIQNFILENNLFDDYWNVYFKASAPPEHYFIIFGGFAFFITFFLLLSSRQKCFKSPCVLAVILIGLILLSILDVRSGHFKIWMWIYPNKSPIPPRVELNVDSLNMDSFNTPRTDPSHQNTIANNARFSTGIVANWYFGRYVKFLERTESEQDARRELLGVIDGRKLFFSKKINYPTIQKFLKDANNFNHFNYHIISYTGDRLILEVKVSSEGYLSFIDNWDKHWKATVNGKFTPIELLFGTFKSVLLPAGKHQVIFSYQPKLWW